MVLLLEEHRQRFCSPAAMVRTVAEEKYKKKYTQLYVLQKGQGHKRTPALCRQLRSSPLLSDLYVYMCVLYSAEFSGQVALLKASV